MKITTRAARALTSACLVAALAGCADDPESTRADDSSTGSWDGLEETEDLSGGQSSEPSVRSSTRATRKAAPSTPPPAPEPVVSDAEISDQAFLLQVAASAPSFTGYPDQQLTSLGRAICGDLGDGYDPYALSFQLADELGADEVEAAGFVGAAMGAYCVQHSDSW